MRSGWRDVLELWPDRGYTWPHGDPQAVGVFAVGGSTVPVRPVEPSQGGEVPVWRREQRSLGAELVADCEAFLMGHFADRLEAQSVAVPVWAWTNLLAHATEHELRAEMFATGAAAHRSNEWHAARAYLAGEVLEAADSLGTLSTVQVGALVPLELALAARADVGFWSCRQWVDAVRSALAHPRSQRA